MNCKCKFPLDVKAKPPARGICYGCGKVIVKTFRVLIAKKLYFDSMSPMPGRGDFAVVTEDDFNIVKGQRDKAVELLKAAITGGKVKTIEVQRLFEQLGVQ